MSLGFIATIFGAIIGVAFLAVAVRPGSQTGAIIQAFGGAFNTSLATAMGGGK